MRLFVQIPCFNEAESLASVLDDLPQSIEGVDEIEVVVVDDGSTDDTAEVAKAHGVRHIVRFPANRGLALGYMAGLDACLRLGADIIVNTDGDHQYRGDDLAALVAPIVEGRADIVVGDRQVRSVKGFSTTKKALQLLGSWVVRRFSGTTIPDATSGFRALSREAAMSTFVTGRFTYTLETLIQAGASRLSVTSTPITVNPVDRPSRLFGSILEYVGRSAATIVRGYAMHRPLAAFIAVAALFLTVGLGIGARFLYLFLTTDGYTGHIQSLILAAILTIAAFLLAVVGVLGDLIAANRRILEDIRMRTIRLERQLEARRRGGDDDER